MLYGVEAYFINDVDDRVVVHGDKEQDFTGDIVCFDIETTGLDKRRDVITEIGAVVLRNGEVVEQFSTFADPERPLTREITELTGITDEMLRGAPSQAEAINAFLDFVGSARWPPTMRSSTWASSPRGAAAWAAPSTAPPSTR